MVGLPRLGRGAARCSLMAEMLLDACIHRLIQPLQKGLDQLSFIARPELLPRSKRRMQILAQSLVVGERCLLAASEGRAGGLVHRILQHGPRRAARTRKSVYHLESRGFGPLRFCGPKPPRKEGAKTLMTPEQLVDRFRHDDVSLLRFLYCDNANIVRGKAALAATAPNFLEAGIGLTVAMQGFTMTERIASDASVGPVGEIRLVPDLDTYVTLPYAPRQAALLCDMQTLDGRPWELCPRSLLKRTLASAAGDGFDVQVGFEHEFYLAREVDGRYVPFDDSLCFSSEGMNSAAPVILETLDALQVQGVQPVQYYPELGPGQQEISIQHGYALRSADNEITARETIRGMARNHGLVASFAPKPFPKEAGSGNHIHLSLWRDGRNAFYAPDDPLGISEVAYGFIAGLLAHLPGLLAITCPSLNSYERLAPGTWSSAYVCYGPDNREASVRIASPFRGHEEGSTNIELKAIDASANPYLALSAVIAAGLDGVRRNLRPGEPLLTNPSALSERELEARGIRRFPATLPDACAALEADELLMTTLGPRLGPDFIAIRHAEWEDLRNLPPAEQTRRHFARY